MSERHVAECEAPVINQVKGRPGTDLEQSVDGVEHIELLVAAPTSRHDQQKEHALVNKKSQKGSVSNVNVRNRAIGKPQPTRGARSWTSIDEFLNHLGAVDDQMGDFCKYIKTQRDEGKPLYQWAKYSGYSALSAAVSKLDTATVNVERMRLPLENAPRIVGQATGFSISVSQNAAYALGVMNEKTEKYLEEMESSTLSEEGKAQANRLIIEELKKLMEHSTRATERVWIATDLIRESAQRQPHSRSWAWSVAGTIMTASIAAVVGVVTAHVSGSAGLDLVPVGGADGVIYTQVLALIQRTQAVTNLTGELYSIKLEDIDQRYNHLAALSESHGLRIDNLVDALGPPNEHGVYFPSKPKIQGPPRKNSESHLRENLDGTARQMQRLQHEMEQMRKNMNRMDIRLTNRIEKMRKD